MSKTSVYVASSLNNAVRARQVMDLLENNNFHITYDWTKHGQVHNEDECEAIAILEEKGVLNCDVFLMVFPGRTGAHVEFGIARSSGKHIILLQEIETERKSFYYLPGVVRVQTEKEAIASILNYRKSSTNESLAFMFVVIIITFGFWSVECGYSWIIDFFNN